MPPPPADSMLNTPLAPSVEKAYYRKCIELKRRLNEVEAANNEAKIRRVRLDRGIMKMRLERAFLLDELRKRMDHNVDGSDNSADEGMATVSTHTQANDTGTQQPDLIPGQPPQDRPHRDKRRRHMPPYQGPPPPGPNLHTHQPPPSYMPHSFNRVPSQAETGGMPMMPGSGAYMPHEPAVQQQQFPAAPSVPSYPAHPPHQQHGSPYGAPVGAPVGVPGAAERHVNGNSNFDRPENRERGHDAPFNRGAGATGESLAAGPNMREDANGERRIMSSASAGNANAESEQQQQEANRSGEAAGFTAVNV
ncbi:hypothetical protein LTR37_017738 [Vermiconidia calcicola]|uniref:Uncharacterized protein n=1 Tax=Vermiconidia calcicola TaxID=1690605 RepID=A0ACC3MKS4_9PEZI|nr:hypothetical protein LTR37_017738 [Vermiconidia calcicola]